MEQLKLGIKSAMQNSGGSYHTGQAINQDSLPAVKIGLFRSLFRGRTDVYPVRFESRKDRKNRLCAGLRERVGARRV